MNYLKRSVSPSYLQSTATECGLACLGYIASHYGATHEMSELRTRFVVTLRGTTLLDLIRIGSDLGFSCRPLRLSLDELGALSTPCILHWRMSHFVVLKEVKKGILRIHDPARGEVCLNLAEADRYFTGVALELTLAPDFELSQPRPRIPLRKLLGRITGLKRGLTQIGLLAIGLQVFALLSPMFMQWVMDGAIVTGDYHFLLVLCMAYALVSALKIVLQTVRSWLAIVLATQFYLQSAGRIIGHLLKLPMKWFEVRHTGDIVSRFQSMQSIQQTLTGKLVEVVIDGFFGLVVLAVMLLYSIELTLVVVSALAIYLAIRTVPHGMFHRLNDEAITHEAKAQSHFLESIRATHTIKLAGLEDQRRSRWLNLFVAGLNKRIETQRMTLGFSIGYSLVSAAESVAVLGIGAAMVMGSSMTIGMLMAFIAYKDDFAGRMQRLIDNIMSLRMMRLHVERLSDIVMTEPEQLGAQPAYMAATPPLPFQSPKIELIDISFRYGEGAPWILRNVYLTVEPGQHLAIVGDSGCGKSTLVKILLGLLEPTEGQIKVNGISLHQFGLSNWRRTVGAVMQDDQLFSGSLLDNIAGFDLSVDMERLQQCCEAAAIQVEIAAMPMGYATHIGDMGSSLSGGQKQRVLISRALYKQPTVLIMDEATSHLDVAKERDVNQAIKAMNITRINIAHRPETIAMADIVISVAATSLVTVPRESNSVSEYFEERLVPAA